MERADRRAVTPLEITSRSASVNANLERRRPQDETLHAGQPENRSTMTAYQKLVRSPSVTPPLPTVP